MNLDAQFQVLTAEGIDMVVMALNHRGRWGRLTMVECGHKTKMHMLVILVVVSLIVNTLP
jgi:hypothetical protein